MSKSYRLGIIANQQENLAERLERFELGSYFGSCAGSADVGFSKPDLAIFEYALEKAGISPQEAIYVGDRIGTRYDSQAKARNDNNLDSTRFRKT